jgi:hypothetical protein
MQASAVPVSRPVIERQTTLAEIPGKNEAYTAGVSWAAVIGGAFVSASLSLILLALGTGLGLSSISPWSNMGAAASTVGKAAIAWLIVTEIMASALGGYLAGRLRTKWVQVHSDEVYFRDTAHGLLVWALGLVVTAAFLGSAATSIAGGAAQGAGNGTTTTTMTTAAADSSMLNPNAYIIDTLFRSNGTAAAHNDAAERGEADRIFAHSLRQGTMSAADATYLAQLVSARTGLTQAEAESRVSDAFQSAQQSADTARKALAHLSLWLFVALLSGAFCASFAGTIGGKQRDRIPV